MIVAARRGEGVGPGVRAFPFVVACPGWLVLVCLLLGLAGWPHAAHAGLYHCRGTHGEAVFTGQPQGYSHCKPVHVKTQHRIAHDSGSAASSHDPAQASSGAGGAVVLRGSVYRVVRADGSVEYTNVVPGRRHGTQVTRLFNYIHVCAACAVNSPIDWATVALHLADYGKAVSSAAKVYGVKPAFLRAIIHAESAFDPDAVSSRGAQGLMQLMPATASSMGVADVFNPKQNIRGGARYLAELLKDFHGNRKLAAAAYNAGPKAVRKYDGVPPYAETRVYVKRVGTLYQRYAKALSGEKLAGAGS